MPDQRAGTGAMTITCQSCGHHWRELGTIEVVDLPTPARVIDHDDTPEREARRLAEISREAQARFATRKAAARRGLRNWAGFVLFLLSPFAVAALFPEPIVAAAPITVKIYEALGVDVNIYGLEFHRLERQHIIVEGTRVLAIKGNVVNVAGDTRKIPWLRFALTGPDGAEIYSWTLDTAARPLRPGESTGFVTRVASPPETAQNLKIRFAKVDEIGSSAGP